MKLFPVERLTIETALTPQEVHQRLADVVEPKRAWRGLSRDHKPYEGQVHDEHFEVTRIIHYRNSFLPVIKGAIQAENGGSKINIVMQPHAVVTAFMIIWFLLVALFFLLILGAALLNEPSGAQSWWIALIPVGMLLFGHLLITFGFRFEADKAKTFFQQLFHAD